MTAKETLSALETLISSLGNIGNKLRELNEALSLADLELSDLCHEKELSRLDAVEIVHHYLKERDALQRRRVIKDEIKLLESFKDFQNEHYTLKNEIITTVKAMNNTVSFQRSRKYCPRVLGNLKCARR